MESQVAGKHLLHLSPVKIAHLVKKWTGDPKATLVLRFIGTTANSFAIRDLLKSICIQLYKATGHQLSGRNSGGKLYTSFDAPVRLKRWLKMGKKYLILNVACN